MSDSDPLTILSFALPIKDHSNHIGIDENTGYFVVSMLREDTKVRMILWLPSGVQVAVVDVPLGETVQVTDMMKRLGWNYSKKKLKEMKKGESFEPGVPLSAAPSPGGPNAASLAFPIGKWEQELAKLESRVAQRFGTYKFGVLYVKEGQTTEEEMFSNRVSSPAFKEFCMMLGDKIELRDWPFFSGGLDTKSDRTGRLSIYTQHCGYEIMFHVSTMLPFNESDQQQIDRKRHIGNDVVIIVFVDENVSQSWSPSVIAARFPHIYAIVKPMTHPVDGSTSWQLNLAAKDTVSYFGPPLPQPPLFADATAFRLFLLSKLINGEREAIRTVPDFRQNNAHLSDLQDLYDKVSKDLKNADSSSQGTKESKSQFSNGGSSSSREQAVSFASDANSSEPDSIAALMTISPRMSSSGAQPLGKSSPSLFGAHHNSHASAIPSLTRDTQLGGSFNLGHNASSRDLRSMMHSSTNLARSSPLSVVPNLSVLTQDVVRKNIQSQLPNSMFTTTETIQAFQNRPSYQNFPVEITCACDPWDGLTIIGTVDGLFILDVNQYGESKIYETKTVTQKHQPYRSNHYLQLSVIEELNILLALVSKVGVVMYDLESLLAIPNTSQARELLLPKTKDATLFALGTYADTLHLASATPRGVVIHRWQDDMFRASQLLPLSQPLVMEFDSRGFIIAASESEFYWVKPDPDNPTSNSMVSWSEKDRGMDPIAVLLFEDSGEYLLCFDSMGYFVNANGQKTRNFDFRWFSRPVSVVSVYPYLLVFCKHHLEIRYLVNGLLCQYFELDSKLESHLRFMSAFNGIQVATVSHPNVGLASSTNSLSSTLGSSSLIVKKDATQDLTSSSGSSTATPTTPTLPASSSSLRSPSPSSSSSNVREGSSVPSLTSTIHTLRLNTIATCLVSNPQQLSQSTSANPSFTVQGVPMSTMPQVNPPQLSPTPPLVLPPNSQAIAMNSTRRVNSARKSGSMTAAAASANLGEFSAGSSPHSPAGSLLQQHYYANEGTASVDDSDDVFRGNSGSAQSIVGAHTFGPEDGSSPMLFRRKSPGREAKSNMTIGSVGSSGSERGSIALPIASLSHSSAFASNTGPTGAFRVKSTDDGAGGAGSKSSSPIRRIEDPGSSSPSRLSSSGKISRRKSLAFESDLNSAAPRRRRGEGSQSSAGMTPPSSTSALVSSHHPNAINLTVVSNVNTAPISSRSASANAVNVHLPHLQIHASATVQQYQSIAKRHGSLRSIELASQFDFDPDFEAIEDDDFDGALPSPVSHASLKQVRNTRVGGARADSDDDDDEDEEEDEEDSLTHSPGTTRSAPSTASPTSQTARKKSARTASDKLSGSSERSPRSSPGPNSGRMRSVEGTSESPSLIPRKVKKLRGGSGSSSSSGTTSSRQQVRSGSDMLAAQYAISRAGGSPASRGSSEQGDQFTGFSAALNQPPSPSLVALSLASLGEEAGGNTSSGSSKQKLINKRNRKSLGAALTTSDLLAEGIMVEQLSPSSGRRLSPGRPLSPNREKTSPTRRPTSARRAPTRIPSGGTDLSTPIGTPTSDSSSLAGLEEALNRVVLVDPLRAASPAKSSKSRSSKSSLSKSALIESDSSGSAPSSPIGTPTRKKSQKTPDKSRFVSPAINYASTDSPSLHSTNDTLEEASGLPRSKPVSVRSHIPSIPPARPPISLEGLDTVLRMTAAPHLSSPDAMAASSDSPTSPRKYGAPGMLSSSSAAVLSPRSSSSSSKKDRRKSEKKTSDSPSVSRRSKSPASPHSSVVTGGDNE